MLGQQVSREFSSNISTKVVRSGRSGGDVQFTYTGQKSETIAEELKLESNDWLINCVGWIPQKFIGDASDEKNALELNVELPTRLDELSQSMGLKVLQVGTDCVFDGIKGGYTESSEKSGNDLYSRTKIMGETEQAHAMIIRTSIIGPDVNSSSGLFSWFLTQLDQPSVHGYVDHLWNGVTTQALARVFKGVVEQGQYWPGTCHLVPSDFVSKYELLKMFEEFLGVSVHVEPSASKAGPKDRTLATSRPDCSSKLWDMGGYSKTPSIREMVKDMISDYLEMSQHEKS